MEKYLYFRTEATDANDDATGDSACWPASSLMGMQPTADSALTLYFKPMLRGPGQEGAADSAANLDNHDSVILNLTTANTHITAMRAIATAVSGDNFPSFIVVADNKDAAEEYLAGSGITSCGAITVAAIYANS